MVVWWEGVLCGELVFLNVEMPCIRRAIAEWRGRKTREGVWAYSIPAHSPVALQEDALRVEGEVRTEGSEVLGEASV